MSVAPAFLAEVLHCGSTPTDSFHDAFRDRDIAGSHFKILKPILSMTGT